MGQSTMAFCSKALFRGFAATAVAAVFLVFSFVVAPPEAFAAGLFGGLAGSWRGDGSVAWSTGETERIRCTAEYTVDDDGNGLVQKLVCATDSWKSVITTDIKYNSGAGAITGTWSETSYGANGRVTGRATSNKIQAFVESTDKRLKARLTVVTQGNSQTVTLTSDIELKEVTVNLRRAG